MHCVKSRLIFEHRVFAIFGLTIWIKWSLENLSPFTVSSSINTMDLFLGKC